MEQFVSEVAKSDWFSVASFAFGALGIILAVVFYFRTKRTKALSFTHRSISIFRDSSPLMSKLQVMYQGKATKNLTLTHLVFWNSGNETIRKIDLVEDDPLRIQIGEGKILDAELLCETHKANGIVLGIPVDSSVDISYTFLDKQNGAAVRVVHTSSSQRDVDLKGTLMGVGKPKKISAVFVESIRRSMTIFLYTLYFRKISWKEFKWLFTFSMVILTVLMVIVLTFGSSIESADSHIGPQRFLFLFLLIPYWVCVLALHKRQLPRELERYLEDFGAEKKD